MLGQEPFGQVLDDSEDVYRAILYPWQWATDQNRPTSTYFEEEIFSVEIKSRTSPEDTASRKNMVTNIIEFNCGFARNLGYDTRDERDQIAPNNEAHAHVYFPKSIEGRKAKARRMAIQCKIVMFNKVVADEMRIRLQSASAPE